MTRVMKIELVYLEVGKWLAGIVGLRHTVEGTLLILESILACSNQLQMQQIGSKAVKTVLNIVSFDQFIRECLINLVIDY